ncbi:MAG TPA: retropepsin-like aspartic protease [Verrucomicrobiae bacterium]|nr:retropepsin-like aspartic protease [Verrucomicrobiae bacterium]
MHRCFFFMAALAALCPASAFAQAYDATPMTAAELLAKAHNARGTLAPGEYVETWADHDGGVDYTQTTVVSGDDFRTTIAGAGFSWAYGVYRGQHWSSEAQINGRGYDFLLDSGASGLTIDPGVVHGLGLSPTGRVSETVGGGDVDIGNVKIPQMSIGSLQLHDVVFDTVPFDQATDKDARLVGLMGFDFLASAIVEIDIKAKTLTLYPRSYFIKNTANTPALHAMQLQLDDGIPRVKASVEGVQGNFLVDTGASAMLAYRET